MFSHPEEIDTTALSTFIEKPCHQCTDADNDQDIQQVLLVLDKNPRALMNILSAHPYIGVSYLLEDLADKMKKRDCVEKLAILSDKCFDTLVEACSYNLYDLDRCVKSIPRARNKIMDAVISNDDYLRRMFASSQNPQATMLKIGETFSDYKDQFASAFARLYSQPRP
jgi:hypothetical protein